MSVIEFRSPRSRFDDYRLEGEMNFTLGEGENVVMIGPNGAGKTLIARYIAGGIAIGEGSIERRRADGSVMALNDVMTLEFKDLYRIGGAGQDDYYQKRWHATETEGSPLVHQILGPDVIRANRQLIKDIGVEPILRKRLINLSSGEQRKLLIVRSLLKQPEVLIIDNPYIGLDPDSRETVNGLLSEISRQKGIKMILIVSHPKDLPEWIDTVFAVKGRRLLCKTTRSEFLANKELIADLFPEMTMESASTREMPAPKDERVYDVSVRMNNVCITYGQTKILHKLSWQINRGEKWALLGQNGSGKSTLLSLVCADNPQAYANDISLFGKDRGTGETIWQIKKRIGYVSPDMHAYYKADITCLDVVSSGFFDAVGLYNKPSEEQRALARKWMETFHCEALADKMFLKSSYGEQRLVLLVRAFVKSPSLLILDEPLHGLDAGKKKLAKLLIEDYCRQADVTLVYVTHYHDEIPSVVEHSMNLIKNS
ncbi:MAG: ATP-binding cassette domain-containing protein [Bacteroidales bacterium]|jgi:molybdate transport system ATP-binding protein|nr:ATP-binding cassette domain-containing protein [Bacteroidales bacterium]